MRDITEIKEGDTLRVETATMSVKRVTEKAMLCYFFSTHGFNSGKDISVWIPKSLCEVYSTQEFPWGEEIKTQYDCNPLPEWFCRKNNL